MLKIEVQLEDRASAQLRQDGKVAVRSLRQSCYSACLEVRREAIANLSGRVMRRRGLIADLAQYVAAQMPEDEGDAIAWGLPEGGEMASKGPQGNISPMAKIGRFFEEGGTIKPVRAKMLRIPLQNGPALTPAGYDRYAGVQLRTVANSGFRVQRSKGGKLFLVRDNPGTKTGKNARSEFWYVLAHQATIKPHPWFSLAVETAQARMNELLDGAFKEVGS